MSTLSDMMQQEWSAVQYAATCFYGSGSMEHGCSASTSCTWKSKTMQLQCLVTDAYLQGGEAHPVSMPTCSCLLEALYQGPPLSESYRLRPGQADMVAVVIRLTSIMLSVCICTCARRRNTEVPIGIHNS